MTTESLNKQRRPRKHYSKPSQTRKNFQKLIQKSLIQTNLSSLSSHPLLLHQSLSQVQPIPNVNKKVDGKLTLKYI